MLYNFMSAFVACLVVVLLGEWISKLTKGWIPSVFISAVILLLCFRDGKNAALFMFRKSHGVSHHAAAV